MPGVPPYTYNPSYTGTLRLFLRDIDSIQRLRDERDTSIDVFSNKRVSV